MKDPEVSPRVDGGRPLTNVAYARSLLTHSRDELRLADAKASSLFTVIAAAVGIATGAAAALSWSPTGLNWPAAVLTWTAVAAAVVSVVLAGAAVYPRTGPGPDRSKEGVAYFGDVVRWPDADRLGAAINRSLADEYHLVNEELLAVSRIAAVKYRLISVSLWALLISAGAAGAMVAGVG